MARPGITYSEVVEAANQVKASGRNPTIEQIRAVLGTGSSTTIANHLREWKQTQDSASLLASKENIPEELIGVVKGLWQRLNTLTDEKIKALESDHTLVREALENEVSKYKNNNQRWQTLFNQWTKEKEHLQFEKDEFKNTIQSNQKEIQTLISQQQVNKEQIQEKQERLNELQRLLAQSQANLEHYRESSREQRLIEQQQFDKQKQELQNELQTTIREMNKFKDLATELKQKLHFLEIKNNEMLKQQHALQNDHTKLQTEKQELSTLYDTEKKENELLLKQIEKINERYDKQTQEIIDLKTQNQIFDRNLKDQNQTITTLKDQHKHLSHENWVLSKEKAQLEGELRRLDKIKTAKA